MDALDKATVIIDMLLDRGGFGDWWHDIERETKNDILEEIAKVINHE